MKYILSVLSIFFIAFASTNEITALDSISDRESSILFNNRPLAKVNGKIISLYDVVQKMNLFMYENFPDYKPSNQEKYQFYSTQWESSLESLITNELVLLDAEKKEITISDGEIREELEKRFGPNIMCQLSELNLEYNDAWKMLKNELAVNQLIGMKIHAKAFQSVTPDLIQSSYEDYLANTPTETSWKYQVLSIRGDDPSACQEESEIIYKRLLNDSTESLSSAKDLFQDSTVKITISDEFTRTTSTISAAHAAVIEALQSNTYSEPQHQKDVIKIFHLKDVQRSEPKSLYEIHDEIKNHLLFQESDKAQIEYTNSLKAQFGIPQNPRLTLPPQYTPFGII